jgi:hypothetical protein
VTLVVGVFTAGKSISGCVFVISTVGLVGGSGKTVIRAVSFFGECAVIGAGIAAAAERTGDEGSACGAGGFVGGRLGKWIRTVSRDCAGEGGWGFAGGDETVIRTVSFFGSPESAIRGRTSN